MLIRDHTPALTAGLAAASIAVLVAACLGGAAPLSLAEIAGGLTGALTGAASTDAAAIVWEIRLPRALTAFVAGAALGLSGAALQALLRNPLAEPGVLGVSSFAALGAVIVIFHGFAAASPWAVPVAGILGALVSAALVALLAARGEGVLALVLVGVGISALAGALITLAMNLAPDPFALSDMMSWLMGSVANRSLDDLSLMLPFVAAGTVVMLLAAPGLRALTLGEEGAAAVGADLGRTRALVLWGTALAVGATVAATGIIGFVGIVAPHLVRPFTAHDPARALVPAALAGGVLLVLADLIVRVLPFETDLKLGVVAALAGAPVFIMIARRLRSDPA